MSKIQHKIEINKYIVETILVDQDTIKEIYHEEGGARDITPSGLFAPTNLIIYVDHDQCKQQMYSTWIHEVFEAINFIYDIQLSHHQIIQLEGVFFSLDFILKGVK